MDNRVPIARIKLRPRDVLAIIAALALFFALAFALRYLTEDNRAAAYEGTAVVDGVHCKATLTYTYPWLTVPFNQGPDRGFILRIDGMEDMEFYTVAPSDMHWKQGVSLDYFGTCVRGYFQNGSYQSEFLSVYRRQDTGGILLMSQQRDGDCFYSDKELLNWAKTNVHWG